MSAALKDLQYIPTVDAAAILGVSTHSLSTRKKYAVGLYVQCRGGSMWNVTDMDAVADLREAVSLTLPAALRVYSALKNGDLDEFIARHYVS